MKTFTRRFCQMKTLSQVVVLSTVALMATGWVLIAVGSPLAPVALIATLLPFPIGLAVERR